MTPPTPDLTALEQWAREQYDIDMIGRNRRDAILALCETVRKQEAYIMGRPVILTEWQQLQAERDAARAEVAHERLRYDGMRSDRDDWRQRAEQAQAEVAQLRSERDEMLMLAEHPQISDMRDLARELVYRGQRIIELESAHTEALVPCCVSAACEYCGGTGVAKEMHHE